MATGDESVTLTSAVLPGYSGVKGPGVPCWEHVITATHDADDTGDVTQAVNINGLLRKIVFTVPNFTNAITGQLVIKDNSNNTIFDSGEQAKAATYAFNVDEPLTGEIDVVMGVSGAAGGTGGSMIAYLRGV